MNKGDTIKMAEQKPQTKKPKYKTYKEAKEAFDQLRENTRGKIKDAIIDMIQALKVEGKNPEETRKILERDLKGVCDRTYVGKLVRKECMTPAEIMAEAQRIENLTAEQKQKEEQTAQIYVGADGNTEMIYESGGSGNNDDKKGNLPTREQVQAENKLKGIKGASGQMLDQSKKSKDSPVTDTSELSGIPDTEETDEQDQQQQRVSPTTGTTTGATQGMRPIVINNPKLIDDLKKCLNTGKEVIIYINNNLVPVHVGTGDPLH